MNKTRKDLLKEIKELKNQLKLEKETARENLIKSHILLFEHFNNKIDELEKNKTIPSLVAQQRICFLEAGEYIIAVDRAKFLLDCQYFPTITKL